MKASPKTEFYADHVVYKLEKVTYLLLKLMWWMGVFIFGIVFIGLVFRANKMNETLHDLENYLTNRFPYQDLVLVLSLPFWLWIFISIFPTIVKWSRQFLLYPKSSITQRDTAVIQLKEKVIHRHSKRSNSASYYLGVQSSNLF